VVATAKRLDFSPRYQPEDVDRAAAIAADQMAPVFKENGWTLEEGLASAGTIALVLRRLIEKAAELESPGEVGSGRFTVMQYPEGDIRIYLDLGGVRPADVREHVDTSQ